MQAQDKLQPTSIITLTLNARVTWAVNKWKFMPHLLQNREKTLPKLKHKERSWNIHPVWKVPGSSTLCTRPRTFCFSQSIRIKRLSFLKNKKRRKTDMLKKVTSDPGWFSRKFLQWLFLVWKTKKTNQLKFLAFSHGSGPVPPAGLRFICHWTTNGDFVRISSRPAWTPALSLLSTHTHTGDDQRNQITSTQKLVSCLS